MGVGYLTGQGGGGSNVKSIQRIHTISQSSTTFTKNYAISSVDINKSVIMISIKSDANAYASWSLLTAKFINSTTIQIQNCSDSISVKHDITIIEYNNVKSKQSGNTLATNQVTINEIDLNKSLLFYSYRRTANATTAEYFTVTGHFYDNKTLEFFATTGNDMTIEWQVIEFK